VRRGVVIATEAPAAAKLLTASSIDSDVQGLPGVGTCCVYFTSDRPAPVTGPVLFLDGDGNKLVNNCCFPSSVSKTYAPPGKTLVSASTVGTRDDIKDEDLVKVSHSDFVVSMWKGKKQGKNPNSLHSQFACVYSACVSVHA
jgi:hypothetical protein